MASLAAAAAARLRPVVHRVGVAPILSASSGVRRVVHRTAIAAFATESKGPAGTWTGGDGKEDHPYLTGAGRYLAGYSYPAPRKLESIIKYALLEREQPHHIKQIWLDFHQDRKDCLADILTPAEYDGLKDRARRFPTFIFPIRKPGGSFFMLFCQWQGSACIFTYLEDYRRNPQKAEPYCALNFYDDFSARKGLVLMRGDFSGHLTKLEAQRLFHLVKYFYLENPKLVEQFNTNTKEFDFNRFLAECP